MPHNEEQQTDDDTELGQFISLEKDTTIKALVRQIRFEYQDSFDHLQGRKKDLEIRLKLYSNQRRDKEAVGDTTLFTTFQTVLAALYSDKLSVEWVGREEGDDEQAENLNMLSQFDYDQMEKDQMDFEWIWNTLFFGRGLVELSEWKRDPENGVYLPIPRVIDPMTFIRDQHATSVNGNIRGEGSARFMGGELKMTGYDIEKHPHRVAGAEGFRLQDISFGNETSTSLQKAADDARNAAQNRQSERFRTETALGVNGLYDITKWYTHYVKNGQVVKIKVWLANDRTKIIALQELGDIKNTKWPVIDRPLYPTASDWDGVSIPDLTEDKQRGRAVAQNLGMDMMKADLYPTYVYDSNKVTNRRDLKFGFNKFIPIDTKGEAITNAIAPINKARPNLGLLDFIYNSLSTSAQVATATPEIQQGAVSEKERTLGELNLVASKIDTRFSLSAKIFGWSEKRFWRRWYTLYKDNFEKGIDKKFIRVVGAFGAKYREIDTSNIITDKDPDLRIESEIVSRAKQLEERQLLTQFFSVALQDPTSDRRYILKKMGKLSGLPKDEIDRVLPLTIDERVAGQQNELLNENKTVPVLPEDDHNVHLVIHAKASLTDATEAHIQTHIKALSIKKTNPEFFPDDQQSTDFQQENDPVLQPISDIGDASSAAVKPSDTSNQLV